MAIHELKLDLKNREDHWFAKLRYYGWYVYGKRFPLDQKDRARQWLRNKHEQFHGSVVEEEIDRLKTLIEETYKE
jgi:hypothetical protein